MPEFSMPVIVLQVVFLVCSYIPGVSQPAKGALLLISLWFFGLNVGVAWCKKRIEGGDR